MYSTYFVSVITTIEKLFQIKSQTIGILMSATEIGQIGTALFLTYYAGRGHRPRWIACGMNKREAKKPPYHIPPPPPPLKLISIRNVKQRRDSMCIVFVYVYKNKADRTHF